MRRVRQPDPVMRILAAFSAFPEAVRWARDTAEQAWGPILMESPPFAFDHTTYYEPDMGPGLVKTFFAMEQLCDPADLPQWKLLTQKWERSYAARGTHPRRRPLNLDPGYLHSGKLVLASTKDHAHRLYLGQGIYGEVTLYYQHGAWRPREWTFADYRRADYHQFFEACRRAYRAQLPSSPNHGAVA